MSAQNERTIRWQDPLLTAGGARGRSGLDFLKAIIDGTIPPAPIQFTMDFELVEVGEGLARFRCTPGQHLYNPMNSVHGGVACTLLDSAMGSAVMTVLDDKSGYTTVDINVSLTRAITTETGPIAAEGRVLHRGSRIVTATGFLRDGKERVLAHATTTCLVLARP